MVRMVEKLNQIKQEALDNKVPIMQDDTMDFIVNYIKENNINRILEIGTAVGYSAITMAMVNNDIKIVTIERDEIRYKKAIDNIKTMNLNDRINVIFSDALDVDINDKFDLLIIDAAKGKNKEFFTKFENNLDRKMIITDNINFHGYVKEDLQNIESRNIRSLVKKIRKYIDFLNENINYKTTFYDIGDGISVSEGIDVNENNSKK